MKKLLITGASGFIGKHLTDEMAKSRLWEIYAVTGTKRDVNFPGNVRRIRANLLDLPWINDIFSEIKPDTVVHLAWQMTGAADRFSMTNISWLEASLRILKSFVENGGRRFLFAGSSSEYGGDGISAPPPDFGGFKESGAAKPVCLYGDCKNAFGVPASRLLAKIGCEYTHARIFPVYGPGEESLHAIPSAAAAFMNGEPFVCKAPNNLWDFVFIKDAVSRLSALAGNDFRGTVNITSGAPVRMRDMFSMIEKETGRKGLLRFENLEKEGKVLFGDAALMNEVFHNPKFTPLEQGIRETIAEKTELTRTFGSPNLLQYR
jgi:nucleoside-diphosphate-sugar epimerase